MKRFILTFLALVSIASLSVKAASVSFTLLPNAVTNLNFAGSQTVGAPLCFNSFNLTANTTNTSLLVFDTPTNTLTYTVGAYTNVSTYATNLVWFYTNYFGVATTLSNIVLVYQTNSVAAATLSQPLRLSASALASTTSIYDGVQYCFLNGAFITNNGTGTATIVINYTK